MKAELYQDTTGAIQPFLYVKEEGAEWRKFDELDEQEVRKMFDSIIRFPLVRKAVGHLSNNGFFGKRELLHQFSICNWSLLNDKLDIDGYKLQFENVKCQHKCTGKCPFNGKGIVCIKN